jgi:hypothetical protein
MSRYYWKNGNFRQGIRGEEVAADPSMEPRPEEIVFPPAEIEPEEISETEEVTTEEFERLKAKKHRAFAKAVAKIRVKQALEKEIGLGLNKEKLQICPMCERPAKIQTARKSRDLDVKGIIIRVEQKLSLCSECGRTFVSSDDEENYLLDAYTIYMKRKDPANRKFRQILFTPNLYGLSLSGGEAWVFVCKSCLGIYQLILRAVPIPKNTVHAEELTCCLKGCKATATHRVSLGKI